MTGPAATLLPDGKRLHLQHGPIDLIIGVDGDRTQAFAAARARFETVLTELVAELPELRHEMRPHTLKPKGSIAIRMDQAVRPLANVFVTRMAAVAGAVADEVLAAMVDAAQLTRAYVNNGGDVAVHLTPGTRFTLAMARGDGAGLGRIALDYGDGIGGIATSGQSGRSLSLGIADSVTVLAKNAASADAAATLIANAVNLPDHPAIQRRPASDMHPDSDLGDRQVVVHCAALARNDIDQALHNGQKVARDMLQNAHIRAAALFLQGETCLVGQTGFAFPATHSTPTTDRMIANA